MGFSIGLNHVRLGSGDLVVRLYLDSNFDADGKIADGIARRPLRSTRPAQNPKLVKIALRMTDLFEPLHAEGAPRAAERYTHPVHGELTREEMTQLIAEEMIAGSVRLGFDRRGRARK